MPDTWKMEIKEKEFLKTLVGWNLESPRGIFTNESESIRFRGWMLHASQSINVTICSDGKPVYTSPTDIARPDVAAVHLAGIPQRERLMMCGFDTQVERCQKSYQLYIGIGSVKHFLAELTPQITSQHAIVGNQDYLFLDGDSNRSVDQFTGSLTLSQSSRLGWVQHFENIRRWETDFGFRGGFLIAPSKEEIFPDNYPHQKGSISTIDQFREDIGSSNLVFPVKALQAQRNYAYDRTDTHWTDAGASLAAAELLKFWELPGDIVKRLPNAFSIIQSIGDLGSKVSPYQIDYSLRFSQPLADRVIFDNGITNNGRIQIYRNSDAPLAKTCLIFGDSFGFNLAPPLSNIFARVVFVYKPASFDIPLVEIERPSFVLFEIAQRFLIGQPNYRKSIFELIAEKILSLPIDRQGVIVRNLENQPFGPEQLIAAKTLAELSRLAAGAPETTPNMPLPLLATAGK